MRKWGLIVTLLYLVIVLALLVPAAVFLITGTGQFLGNLRGAYGDWFIWVNIALFVSAEALLLLLTVDTSERRMKPRAHILVSATTTGVLLAVLSFAVVLSVVAARWGDHADTKLTNLVMTAMFLFPWIIWTIIFYRMTHDANDAITRTVSWLMRGSVLELLIAVPAHVIVRRRHDCSAPVATGFGISSGIAIMLLSFGPSVLLLYKKRMEALKPKSAAASN